MTPSADNVSQVLGVPINSMKMGDVLRLVQQAIISRKRLRVGVVNAAKLVNMRRDSALDLDVRSSNLILADGMSVVWASCLNKRRLPERIAGIDLMHDIMRQQAAHNSRVYLLGARANICKEVAERAVHDYPGLKISGYHDGYFEESEEQRIVDEINHAQTDILFVAITSPKKERFMARWEQQLTVPIIHGVGGSFDVYAGKVTRAPKWMQNAGLEWLYRIMQEPSRMWRRYLVTNALFVWYLIKDNLTIKA